MIFICVGSREYQFDRLLKEIDELVEEQVVSDDVFAQIGQSTYLPQHYNYEKFISVDQFNKFQYKADIIISHGGTGALIGALKKKKQVIAVPRLARFGEHIDDHQTQVVEVLEKEGYLRSVTEIKNLLGELHALQNNPITKEYNKPSKVTSVIEDFILNDGFIRQR